jgi:hypothetical protein
MKLDINHEYIEGEGIVNANYYGDSDVASYVGWITTIILSDCYEYSSNQQQNNDKNIDLIPIENKR